ncbi:galactokinase [Limnoraphis robusta]|uniref:Galactokinase n=1 Tax=Limnoraphis robusta CCNP1315 TaxID=3110306 RepID=A0ABU5U0G6_9CYAN|nr:galactokinase [Limnoraphis robusta]MEA5519628.1 galactokinase [Limnoraphis robusta CCNP1315]
MGREDDVMRACDLFAARFSWPHAVHGWASGRVNLIGDHVDYQGGVVLPMPIGLGCGCAAGPGGEPGRVRVASTAFDGVHACDGRDAMTPGLGVPIGHWASYAAGVVAEIAALAGREGEGVDLALAGSVPVGSGLSSSAAVEVAVARAVCGLWGVELEPMAMARLCQRAEHRFAGAPCGLMDQATAVLGRSGSLLRLDCRDGSFQHVRLPDTAAVFVLDTGGRHVVADGAYAARRAAAERAAGALGVRTLRDAEEVDLSGLPDVERDAATHVTGEIRRVEAACDAFRAGDLGLVGRLMDASHASLRDVYRVSCPELDAVVEAARAAPGVFGARMTGAGFGGCAVALVDARAAGGFEGAFRGASECGLSRATAFRVDGTSTG